MAFPGHGLTRKSLKENNEQHRGREQPDGEPLSFDRTLIKWYEGVCVCVCVCVCVWYVCVVCVCVCVYIYNGVITGWRYLRKYNQVSCALFHKHNMKT